MCALQVRLLYVKRPVSKHHSTALIDTTEMKSSFPSRGWVYAITNPAFAGLVKVGFTLKDPELRARELKSTGVPYEYRVEYEVFCINPKRIETEVHQALKAYNEDREWFRCDIAEAVDAIVRVAGNDALYMPSSFNQYAPLSLGKDEDDQLIFRLRDKSAGEKLRYICECLQGDATDDSDELTTNGTSCKRIREGLRLLGVWLSYHSHSEEWEISWLETLLVVSRLPITNRDVRICADTEAPDELRELRMILLDHLIHDESASDLVAAKEIAEITKSFCSDKWILLQIECDEATIHCMHGDFVAALAHLTNYLDRNRESFKVGDSRNGYFAVNPLEEIRERMSDYPAVQASLTV